MFSLTFFGLGRAQMSFFFVFDRGTKQQKRFGNVIHLSVRA